MRQVANHAAWQFESELAYHTMKVRCVRLSVRPSLTDVTSGRGKLMLIVGMRPTDEGALEQG